MTSTCLSTTLTVKRHSHNLVIELLTYLDAFNPHYWTPWKLTVLYWRIKDNCHVKSAERQGLAWLGVVFGAGVEENAGGMFVTLELVCGLELLYERVLCSGAGLACIWEFWPWCSARVLARKLAARSRTGKKGVWRGVLHIVSKVSMYRLIVCLHLHICNLFQWGSELSSTRRGTLNFARRTSAM